MYIHQWQRAEQGNVGTAKQRVEVVRRDGRAEKDQRRREQGCGGECGEEEGEESGLCMLLHQPW